MYGTLKVGDRDLRIVSIRPERGVLLLTATGQAPVELAVERVTWLGLDSSVICVIAPFLVSEDEAENARTANDQVSVIQPIKITEVVSVGGQLPS